MSILNEEQESLRKVVADFAAQEIAPKAAEWDEKEEFPWENIHKMAGLGLMGMPVPEELGGAGTDTVTYISAIEEISKADASTGAIMAVHTSTGIMPILYNGTNEQKKKYIPDLAMGKKIGAFALTEPNAGSDAAGVQTTALLNGDEYILNGVNVLLQMVVKRISIRFLRVQIKAKGPRESRHSLSKKGFRDFLLEKRNIS